MGLRAHNLVWTCQRLLIIVLAPPALGVVVFVFLFVFVFAFVFVIVFLLVFRFDLGTLSVCFCICILNLMQFTYHLGATHTPKCPCLLSISVGSSPAQPHNPLPTLWPPRTRALAKWALSRSSCFPITSPKPTSSKYFPGIALPKKSVQVCQLRSAFQLLTHPPSFCLPGPLP